MAAAGDSVPAACDVVVAGLGIAGMAAAITAHDAGADVVIVEKQPPGTAGGNSRVAGNVWFNPTADADPERYLHAMAAGYAIDGDVARAWAAEIAANTSWVTARLEEARDLVEWDPRDRAPRPIGVELTPYGRALHDPTAGEKKKTSYEYPDIEGHECDSGAFHLGPTQGFSRLWRTLLAAVGRRGVTVLHERPATGLIQDEDGTVLGLRVGASGAGGGEQLLLARQGVVLATGGFAGNQRLAQAHLRLPKIVPWGSPFNTGDGIRIAQEAGAELGNMFSYAGTLGMAVPDRAVGAGGQPRGKSWIFVRADGRRYVDETVRYSHGKAKIGGSYRFYPEFGMRAIFDEKSRLAGPVVLPYQRHTSGWMKTVEEYEWSADNSVEIEAGWIEKADTLEELAQRLGADPTGLLETVDDYNRACADGAEDRFGRPADTREKLDTPPYYGFNWGPLVTYTNGGPRKDGKARVLRLDGTPIEGLYCCGEVSSTYPWCVAGGMMIGDAMAFGRIAGREVSGRVSRAT
jgi:succinate dehydrogenase/fumarate reductase flavoprotein subunit